MVLQAQYHENRHRHPHPGRAFVCLRGRAEVDQDRVGLLGAAMKRASLEEMRDALLAEKTAEHIVLIRAKVESGDVPLGLITNGVADLLCDSHLSQQIARLSLIVPAAAGVVHAWLTEHVIADQAEVEATLEVERMERNRLESRDEARIDLAVFEQDMALYGWGGMS